MPSDSREREESIRRAAGSENARKCPVLPDPTSFVQNEPTAAPTTGNPQDEGLLPRQLAAIDLLFAGHNFRQVCAALRIDAKTLYRWRRMSAFAAEVRRRYASHRVARQPRRERDEPLIPPATPSAVAASVVATERERRGVRDHAYWKAVCADPDRPLPPPSDDEPFWVSELRRIQARLARYRAPDNSGEQ